MCVRLKCLHDALKEVIDLHSTKKKTGLRWLFCPDSVGWQLQLLSSFLLFVEAFGFGNPIVIVDGAILLFSLGPMILLQHAMLENRSLELASRARQMLSFIEKIGNVCEKQDVVASDAFTFVPNSRCISNTIVSSASNVDIAAENVIPAQLLVADDEIRQSPDEWIMNKYCKPSPQDRATEQSQHLLKTPSAVQLEAILCKDPQPESFYEYRHKSLVNILRKMLLGAMILSVLSSILHVLLASNGRYFENLVLRNVDVCLPILPLSFSLLSILLQVGCNAYVGALIQIMQNSLAVDYFVAASVSVTDSDGCKASRRRGSRRTWLQKLRGVVARADSDNDRISMLPAVVDSAETAATATIVPSAGIEQKVRGMVPMHLWWAHVRDRLHHLLTFSFGSASRDPAGDGGGGGGGAEGWTGDVVAGLGCATVLSFTDMHGVLADAVASPRHIFVLTPPPPPPSPKEAAASGGGAPEGRGAWAVLELMGDGGGSGGVNFEDGSAARGHMGQLKPLGLDCLLNTNAHAPAHALAVEETLRVLARAAGAARSLARARPPAFVSMASCDTADASHLLGPVRARPGLQHHPASDARTQTRPICNARAPAPALSDSKPASVAGARCGLEHRGKQARCAARRRPRTPCAAAPLRRRGAAPRAGITARPSLAHAIPSAARR